MRKVGSGVTKFWIGDIAGVGVVDVQTAARAYTFVKIRLLHAPLSFLKTSSNFLKIRKISL